MEDVAADADTGGAGGGGAFEVCQQAIGVPLGATGHDDGDARALHDDTEGLHVSGVGDLDGVGA